MPILFKSSLVPTAISPGGNYKIASQGNIQPTPIVITNATSSVAGQITLVWSGGVGINTNYSYTLSNSNATVTNATTSTTSGVNTTTITFSPANSISTSVTVTAKVLDGSTSATSSLITTTSALPTLTGTYSTPTISGYSKAYMFTGDGTIILPETKTVQVLIVGGGGAGGCSWAQRGWGLNGGGAGGLGYGALT
jgi:hypothetical protein